MSAFVTKQFNVKAIQGSSGTWTVTCDDDSLAHHAGDWLNDQFSLYFEPYEKQARRDMQRRREHTIIMSQRRELRRMNRVISALKSRYLTLFGEIDRALGEDLPRSRSNSYQAGYKEGYKEGFAYGYDVAKGGKQ